MIDLQNRLQGKSLLISASVPAPESKRYHRIPRARQEIEEAVISITRATLSQGGNIVLGGQPSIATLVTMVATEYIPPRYAEGRETDRLFRDDSRNVKLTPITIYQSEQTRSETPELEFLSNLGYVDVRWVPTDEDRKQDDAFSRTKLQRIIEESNPVAMICIGGMEDVEREASFFREMRERLPIYVMATSGGAAARIAGSDLTNIRTIDRDLLDKLKQLIREVREDRDTDEEIEIRYTPYALIMQKIISEINSDELFG